MDELIGKCLVRKASNGKIIVCGVFETNAEVDPSDEMWAVKLMVMDVKKMVNSRNANFSPEDFLEGTMMDHKLWSEKP